MTATTEKRKVEAPSGASTLLTILKYLALFVVDALALVIVYTLVAEANIGLALVFGFATVLANVIIFVPGLYPLRWMAPGLVLVTLLVIYPIIYTVITATTNYGDGHLFTKSQAMELIENRLYVPEDARTYDWVAYQSAETGEFALWLSREGDEGVEVAFAREGQAIEDVEVDDAEAPAEFDGYAQIERRDLVRALSTLQELVFGEAEDTAQIRNSNEAARPLEQRYLYDAEEDSYFDQQTGDTFRADNSQGVFVNTSGEQIAPGYRVNIGLENFDRLVNDPALSGPLVDIFVWTIVFAGMSVFTTFALGLFMALVLNDVNFLGKKVLRSVLIIPYAIPAVISILVWQGMLNSNLGVITAAVESITGQQVLFLTDAWWAKFSILLVNLWLGYPYMMLVTSGALQAIPSDIYEAAAVDGATPVQRFWNITLPLLLVTVGPLLIASFVYNFNNYLLIDALTSGDPPIPNTPTPAGYTDILISYTYRLAFGSNRGADYGYASAITMVIFAVVVIITLLQFQLTKTWEEVGENV